MWRISFRSLAVLAAAAAVTLAPAFHDGGVGSCAECHVMHDDGGGAASTEGLLLGENSTDVCLRCHETTNGNTWGVDPLNPGPIYGGGPFVFLLEDNLNDGPGGDQAMNWILGNRAGHNVISLSHGVTSDPDFPTSPNGTYPSMHLTCTSCHDPHGNGNFRLLYGSGQTSRSDGYDFTFSAPAPLADGISLYGAPESSGNHTSYRSGVSDWCGSCHGLYHRGNSSAFRHGTDRSLGGSRSSIYNAYRGTGYEDGDGSDAYLPLVPVEDASGLGTSYTGPVSSSSQFGCLSCHRAHASSGPASGRWDFNIATWADEGTVSGSYPIPNPYLSTAGFDQGPLCEKCHGSPAAAAPLAPDPTGVDPGGTSSIGPGGSP